MNILFYHKDETCPTMGGIQRTTAIVAEELRQRGDKVYNIYDYKIPYPVDVPRYHYDKAFRLNQGFGADEVADIINKEKIDVIINQMGIPQNGVFREAIKRSGRTVRLYYFHHNTPRRLWDLSFSGARRALRNEKGFKRKLKNFVKLLSFPLYRIVNKTITLRQNAADYRKIYNDADAFVLLSSYFQEEWTQLTGITDLSRLKFIPNARSFDKLADDDIISKKENRVLIVARMIEFPKQILVALKIWDAIVKEGSFSNWYFDIVGTGPDLEEYKRYAEKHNIPRVVFHGRQESMPFYEKSSIFLMPSIREGWPMTLMESMQMGVVPVAFDSFGAVREIIKDGETGFLVKPFDKKEFADKLRLLLTDENLRVKMAKKAIKSTDRFTKEKIMDKWITLLNQN